MKSQTDAAFVLAVCKHSQRRERVGELHPSAGPLSIPPGHAGQRKLIWRCPGRFINKVGIWLWHVSFQIYFKKLLNF